MTGPTRDPARPSRERVAALALAALAGLLAWVSPVANTSSDPALGLLAAQALVDHGSLSLDPYRGDPACPRDLEGDYRLRAWRGSLYYFTPGAQVLSTPFVWAARRAGLDMRRPADEAALQELASALLIALDTLLLASLLRRLCSPAPALAITAVLVLGSPLASTLATALWAAGFAVPLLLLAAHVLAGAGEATPRPRAVLAALALVAVAYACRPAAACFLPGLLAWAWRGRPTRRAAGLGALGALAGLAALAWLTPHLPRYFSPAKLTPQTPPLLGLYGVLLSPSRGLLVFCPFAVPVLAAAWRARLWRQPLFRLAAAWLGSQVLLLSVKGNWWGGHSYGPRLLTEAVPALGLMAALAFSALPPPRRGWAAAFAATGAAAVAIHSGQGLWNSAVLAFNRGPDPRAAQALVLWWRYPQFLATDASVARRDLELQARRLRPLAPGEEARAMSDQLVFDGFHAWERAGLRRAGPVARVRFRPASLALGQPFLLELRGSVLREQPVRLLLRGRPLDEAVLAPPEAHAWRVPLPAGSLDGEVELELLSPAAGPGGPDDPRRLGFTFHGLRLLPDPPRPPGRLRFDDDLGFLRGFADADGGGRWTRDGEALLRLPSPAGACPCRVELEAGALGRQRVEARAGGRRLAEWTFDGSTPQVRWAELPAAEPGAPLTLGLPDARPTPGDPRRLGLHVLGLRLVSSPARISAPAPPEPAKLPYRSE